MLGQPDDAIAELKKVLSRSGELTTHVLRLDPRWSPLKSSARFAALLAGYDAQALNLGRTWMVIGALFFVSATPLATIHT